MKQVKIGVPVRYYPAGGAHDMMGCITESTRLAVQAMGGVMQVIYPVQDVRFGEVSYRDVPELIDREQELLVQQLETCDGLLLPGGERFAPYDRWMVDYAIKKDMPLLGICMGMQLISLFGGKRVPLRPTIENHGRGATEWVQHKVKILAGSCLAEILGKTETTVNSHHGLQAVNNPKLQVVAKSLDGVIEAIERPGAKFCLGVQWHPERDYRENEDSRKIIGALVQAARGL